MSTTLRTRLGADAALLAVAAAWGLTFPLAKIVLAVLPPLTYLAARFVVAALVLLVVVLLRPRRSGGLSLPSARAWLLAMPVGVVLFLGYGLQAAGLRLTTASNAGFITGLSVAMVPVISALWLRQAPRPVVLAGVAVASVGLALLTLEGSLGVGTGDLLVLACAACFALHIVLVGRLARALDYRLFAAAQVIAVAALSAAGGAAERPIPAITAMGPGIWAAVVVMALTGTVAALLVQSWAQRFTTPSHTALMFTFEPVAAALLARLILGEVLAGRQALGATLILTGIVLAELGPEIGGTGGGVSAIGRDRPARTEAPSVSVEAEEDR